MTASDIRIRKAWLPPLILVAVAFVAYANSFSGPFIFDDPSSITGNPTIRHLWPPWAPLIPPHASITAQGRPILNLSLAINYALGGTGVVGYHVMNVAIHAIAGLALFGIARRTLRTTTLPAALVAQADSIALAGALIWVAHPIQTEAVTYVIQRAESLMGMFYLLTFYAFVRAAQAANARWQFLCVGFCALGMATKEVMVSAPVMIWLYDRTFLSGSFGEAWRRRSRLYVGLFATWLLLGALVVSAGGNRGGSAGFGVGVRWWDYGETQFVALVHYLRLALWPHPLVFEYGTFWINDLLRIVPEAVTIIALGSWGFWAVLRRRPIGFMLGFFFAILSVTSLVPGTTQMIVEHRMYLPLAMLSLGAAAFGFNVLGRRASPALLCAAAGLSILTLLRNHDYRSDVSIWRDTVQKRPANALAHEMYGAALDGAGQHASAVTEYTTALKLYPRSAFAQDRLGEDLMREGKTAEAITCFENALQIQPDFIDAHNNLGIAFATSGHAAEAARHFEAALRINPEFADAHYNLGNLLSAAGDASEAIAHYETALRLRPDYFEARFNLANSEADSGRIESSIADYARALELRPAHPRAHYNFANTLAGAGRLPDAIRHYRRALEIDPGFTDAAYNLGVALQQSGRREEAISTYEAALRSNPGATDIQDALRRLRR